MNEKDLEKINKNFDELKNILVNLPNGEALGTEIIIKTALWLSKTYGDTKTSETMGYLETAKYLFMQRQPNLNSANTPAINPAIKKLINGEFPK